MANKKGTTVFLDLNNNSNTKGQTALSSNLGISAQKGIQATQLQLQPTQTTGTAQKPKKVDYEKPYGDEWLDKKYQDTVRILGNLQKKTKSNFDVIDDAMNLMDTYMTTVRASYALNKGIAGKDYLRIGDNEFQRQLEQTIYKYQYGSMDAAGLEKALEGKGYQTNGQQKALTEQNVIGRAKEMGAGMTPEERRRANYLDALADATNARPWTDGQNGNVKNNQSMALLGMGGETNQSTPQSQNAALLRDMEQELRAKDNITLADAEKYLSGLGWEYGFAKEHPGDLSGYAAAFSQAGDIVNRAMINGVDKLNDKEKEVYYALQGNNGPELGAGLLGMGGMTNQELQGYTEWGRQQAAALQGVNGLYINQQPDREMQFILNQYRQTPEGAKAWAQDAAGTEEEQEAKQNEWFVTRRAKFDEVPTVGNYAEDSQPQADFSSGDATLDRYYRIINNIGGERDSADLYQAMSGGNDPALTFFYNTDETDQGKFTALMNRGQFDEARDYLDYMQYAVNEKTRERTETAMYNLGNNGALGAIAASALSVPLSLTRGMGALDIGLQNLRNQFGEYRPVDYNRMQAMGAGADAARQGVQDQVNWEMNVLGQDVDLFDFLYGTAMSGVDSMAAGALGSWAGPAVLGLGAAQNTMMDLQQQGGNDRQVMIGGALAGAFETLFEHISIGQFYDEAKHLGKRSFGEHMKNILAQAGINFSEEFNTELFDMIAEESVMGSKAQTEKQRQEYLDLGLTEEEANARIAQEKALRLLEAGFGGALMGGAFGGISNVTSDVNTSRFETKAGKVFDAESKGTLKSLGSSLPDGEAKALARKYDPEKATDRETGALVRAIMQELPQQAQGSFKETFVLGLLNSLEDMSPDAAGAIADMMSGQQLAPEQIDALARDQAGMQAVYALLGVKGETGRAMQKRQAETEQAEEGPGTVEFEPMPGMESGDNIRSNEQSQKAEQGGAAYKPREKRLPVMVLEEGTANNGSGDIDNAEAREPRTAPSAEEKQEQGPDGRQIVDAGEGTKGAGQAVMSFQVDEESGAVTAEMEDGSRQDVEELPISDAQKEIAQETAGMDAEAQAAVMQNYDGKRPAKQYTQGMKNVYQAARKGQSLEEIRSLYGEDLDDPQRKAAWEAGRAAYEKEEQRALDDTRRNQDKAKADGYNFKVLEQEDAEQQHKGVYLARVRNAMTRNQEIQLAVLEDVLNKKGIPVQIRVYDTMDDKNGSYQAGSNIINVALDAEGGLINRTVSHELYHFVKEWNQEAAGKLQAFVIDTLNGTETFDLDKRRQDIARQYRDRAGQELTADAIDEEIAAESMLDAIDTQENLQAFYKNADKSLIERITNWIKDTVAKIRDAMARIGRNHPEVEAMRGNLAALEKIQNDLLQAAQTAGQNYLAARAGLNSQAAQDADVMAYQEEMSRAVTPELAQEARNGLESKLFARYYADMGGNLGGLEYEDAFQRFQAAMEVFGSGESKSLAWAFNQAKIPVPKKGMNSVLSYAARQMAAGAREAASVKNELKAGQGTEENYSYETLTAKPDMKIISLTGISDEDLNKINQSTTREFAKNILEGIKKRNHGSAQVYVNDIKRPVLIGTESIKHSIGRTLHKGYVEISQKLDEILSQAIAVNELNPRDNRTNYSTVLLGFAETDTQYYGVRFIVNNQTWKADSYDILYSISKSEIKKEGPVISTPGFPTKSDSGTPSKIRIADLLNLVKESPEISSVFSRNVAAKLGIERPNNPAITPSLKFSLQAPVEETRDLVAIHNVDEDGLKDALEFGGLPSPSIAVIRGQQGHSKYGDVSLVFAKATIDPKRTNKNKLYGTDAWTPTRQNAQVETELLDEVLYKARDKAETLLDGEDKQLKQEANRWFNQRVGDDSTTDAFSDWEQSAYNNIGLLAAYLKDHGNEIPIQTQEVNEDRGYRPERAEMYNSILDNLVERGMLEDFLQDYSRISEDAFIDKYGPILSESGTDGARVWNVYKAKGGKTPRIAIVNRLQQAMAYYFDGRGANQTTKTENDWDATRNEMRRMIHENEFSAWLKQEIGSAFGKKGIRNQVDQFTAAGNRRSFNQLHWEYTLENIVRAMNSGEAKGGYAGGATGLMATSAKEYKSIDEMRADKNRLQNVDVEVYEDTIKALESRMRDFVSGVYYRTKTPDVIIRAALTEAGRAYAKGKTENAISRAFIQEGCTLTEAEIKEAAEIIKQAQNIPTGYFEAKPQRAVDFSEVQRAVVPDTMSAETIQRMKDAGVREVVTYPAGDEEARKAAVNERQDLMFSLRADSGDQQEQQALEDVRADADLYAQAISDEFTLQAIDDFAQIYQAIERVARNMSGDGTQEGNWKKRTYEIANRLKTETGSTMSTKEAARWISRVFQAIDKGGYVSGEVLMYARDFGMELLKKAPGMEIPMDETTKEIRRIVKERGFFLTDGMKSEIAGTYGSVEDFRRKNFGKMRIVKQSASTPSLAEVWTEDLSRLNPGVFAEDVAEADMPRILDGWLETSGEKKYTGEFGANATHYATSIALELMMDYLDAPWSNTRIKNLAARYDRNVKKVRTEYQSKYEERMSKDKEKKEVRERKDKIISSIRQNARYINTRVMNPKNTRHIPEEYRGAAEAFVYNLYSDRAIFSADEAREYALKYAKWASDEKLHEIKGLSPQIQEELGWLAQNVTEDTPLKRMTEEQLNKVDHIVGNFRKIIEDGNSVFMNGKQQDLDTLVGSEMAALSKRADAKNGTLREASRKFFTKELTPIYYAKRVGGVVESGIREFIEKQSDYIFKDKAAKAFYEEAVRLSNVNGWLYDKPLEMTTKQGDKIILTKNQAMSLYAWWKRETTNSTQSAEHLRLGGFTYDTSDKDTRNLKGVDLYKPHIMMQEDFEQISDYLSQVEREFADKLVDYLSNDVAAWCNEMSMRMYGYNQFEEKYYFPYPTDPQYRSKGLTQEQRQKQRLKNWGGAKPLTEYARNPLKLQNFTDLWLKHVNEAAMYSTYAEAIDNLDRVTNYVYDGEHMYDEEGNLHVTPPTSLKKRMEQAYGREAVQYLETLLDDLNGGVRNDDRTGWSKATSLFKKGSVAANLSVVLQQPSAFVRAMSMVNPKYFAKALTPSSLKSVRGRMYENSGAANIKDMGRFDTNVGKSAEEWMGEAIKPESRGERIYNGMDKWTGKGAEIADDITWCYMYAAVENEIEDNTDLERGTEAFNAAAAKRFDEVMTQTQVYDSTLAKSEYMRGTGEYTKMLTSFMAEPTLTANMLINAAWDVIEKRPGAKKAAAVTLGVFVGTAFVNALLKSFATALRRTKDEDKGRTYWEKYLAEAAGNFADDVNPFGIAGMLPVARDIVSLAQGYDVERADMSIAADLIKYLTKAMKADSSAADWLNLAGAAGNLFGIPARNVIRDVGGIWKTFFGGAAAKDSTSDKALLYGVLENIQIGPWSVWDSSRAAYYDRMEEALKAGDMDRYNELRGYVEETLQVKSDTVDSGIKKEIKESLTAGLISDDRAIELLEALGMDSKKAFDTAYKWAQTAGHEDDEDFEYNKYGQIQSMIAAGQDISAEVKRFTAHGTSDKTMESAVKGAIKDLYTAGTLTDSQTENSIKKYLGITDKEEIHWLMDEWAYKRDNGAEASYSKYVDVYDAVRNGTSLTAAMQEMTQNGYTEKDVRGQIKSKIAEWYKKGELTKAQTESKLKQYAGITDSNDLYWVMDQMDYEKSNPQGEYRKYNEFYRAVETGSGLQSTVKKYMDHGVKAETMASQITSQYKAQYVELYRTNKTKAAELKARLLTAYAALGYDRSKKQKDIDKWLK